MTDTMRERVARAIAHENGDDWDDVPDNKTDWNRRCGPAGRDINAPFKPDYRDVADAALAAMREPSEAMRKAGQEWVNWCGKNDETPEPESGWRNMIDAALNETEQD